jgi:endonuclease/exonuclease/phosphatase family metal-dependent hydrolase
MSTQKVWDMSLKLFDLNIEGHDHLDRWLPFAAAGEFDVICLQEIFEVDLPRISKELGMKYVFSPVMDISQENEYEYETLGIWGVAILTNLPVKLQEEKYYAGSRELKVFVQPGDAARVLLSVVVEKDGQEFRVATTHFTWTPDGHINAQQEADFNALAAILTEHPDWIFTADFNAPRGREMFSKFAELFTDNLPPDVLSTLDPDLHYKKGELQLAVDTVFTTAHYKAENVQVHTGLSDHCGITANIFRVNS